MLRKLSAHYIFPGDGKPIKRGIVVVNENGKIQDLIDTAGSLPEIERLEFYDGIITPGFINAHTHLELSHLKGCIEQHTGLASFLRQIGQLRKINSSDETMLHSDKSMVANGIVAVGDISNTDISFPLKTVSKIRYFTFIELFGIQDNIAEERFNTGISLLKKLYSFNMHGTITPHAPYSISDKLWELLIGYAKENNQLWSIHNQESAGENELFMNKTGEISDFLSLLSTDFAAWKEKGISSLPYCQQFYEQISKVLLVHNTFTSPSDINSIEGLRDKVFFILCPNANLYIENKLPDIAMLASSGFPVALGTDSLASNTKLSILEEMKTIQRYFPQTSLSDLIGWATINGARALGFDVDLGSLSKGKIPGLNLVTNVNFQEMKLTSQSEVKVLV
jgi:aminodeoxyfutalosine deaminase